MDLVNIIVALLLGALVYVIVSLFLPYAVAVILAVLVILVALFGGFNVGSFGGRGRRL